MNAAVRICPHCGEPIGSATLSWGGWTLDDFGVVQPTRVKLRPKTRAIAVALVGATGGFVTMMALYEMLYGLKPYADQPEVKIIHAHVWRLRKTLHDAGAPDFVESSWGRGYRAVATRSGSHESGS